MNVQGFLNEKGAAGRERGACARGRVTSACSLAREVKKPRRRDTRRDGSGMDGSGMRPTAAGPYGTHDGRRASRSPLLSIVTRITPGPTHQGGQRKWRTQFDAFVELSTWRFLSKSVTPGVLYRVSLKRDASTGSWRNFRKLENSCRNICLSTYLDF